MQVHRRISGVLMAVLGGMGLLSFLSMLGMVLLVGNLNLWVNALPSASEAAAVIVVALLILFLVFVLWCVAALMAGLAAAKDDPNAGRVLVPVAVLALIGFPMGTVAGVYTLWAWWRTPVAPQPEWKRIAERRRHAQLG